MKKNNSQLSRRKFIEKSIKGTIASTVVLGMPTIVPASVFGKNAFGRKGCK